MKTKEVPYSWIDRLGKRLDCGPYMDGAIEAKFLMEKLAIPKSSLNNIVEGVGGIYKGKQLKRIFVEDASYGVPFLTTSGMLQADLSKTPLLKREVADSDPGCYVQAGMTLISAAGTIGRMVYGRSDMCGMFACSDILKISPRRDVIRSGYLYAFLSSRFGVGQVTAGTYGSIIQHLDPIHIADLPVPRFGDRMEREVHDMIEKAASLRVFAARTLRDVSQLFDALISDIDISQPSPRVTVVPASKIQKRFDAQFHDPIVQHIRVRLGSTMHTTIGEWCTRVFLPGIFKRIHIDDLDYGALYYTGASLFWLEPIAKGILSSRTTLFKDVLLKSGMVLVQAFGQEGGLTGRAVWVGKHLDGATSTHMLVRLEADSRENAAYLYGFLQSTAAYRQIASLTFGGSIPHFDEDGISNVLLPLLTLEQRQMIAADVLAAMEARDEALSAELAAREKVERAIEEAA